MTIKEDLKFTKIVGIVNIILFVISAAFYIIRMYTPSSTVSIISGGVLLLFMFTSYVFMISSFEGLSNLIKNTYNEDYKKDPNYKTFILYIIYSVSAFFISLLFLIITYIRYDFVKNNDYKVLNDNYENLNNNELF
jgi:hypothetical protein